MEQNTGKFVIILWSVSSWEEIRRRPMITALAKNISGFGNILYVNTSFSPVGTVLLNYKRYIRDRKKPLIEKITQNLYVFRPKGLLNEYASRALLIQKNHYKNMGKKIVKIVQDLGWDHYRRISWINYPYQFYQLGAVNEQYVVYECYDEYRFASGKQKNKDHLRILENRVLERAAIVFTTSRPLYESRKLEHPHVFLTENGVDFDLFSVNKKSAQRKIPSDFQNIPAPIIGYVGTFRDWLDYGLLTHLVEKLSSFSFVFIGPCSARAKKIKNKLLKKFPNVFFLGEKAHHEIPNYLHNFDVGLLPFKTGPFGHALNPLKLWEYFAGGIPVVSTKLKALTSYGRALFLSDSPDNFIQNIECILKQRKNETVTMKVAHGIALAREHSWDTITKSVATLLVKNLNLDR